MHVRPPSPDPDRAVARYLAACDDDGDIPVRPDSAARGVPHDRATDRLLRARSADWRR